VSRRPIGRPSDPGAGNLYDAIQTLGQETLPEDAPKLRALAIGTLAQLRKTRGDVAGNAGPASCMLSGFTSPMDGGQGVFLWDPTSVAKDDGGVLLPGGTVQVANVATGRWRRTSPPIPTPTPAGTLLRTTRLTGTSTLAKAVGCTSYVVEFAAGGGQGGGAAGGGVDSGGGGAAGGYAKRAGTTVPATWSWAMGAGGSGAGAGSNGNAGSDSTFTDSSVTVTAHGGPGGQLGGVPGAAPAVSTNGTVNGSGAPGNPGIAASGISGAGGSSAIGGGGGAGRTSGNNAGLAATGPASGGGGATCAGGAAQAGGAGTAGEGFLMEYS
jgi:hypothetical protein